MNGQKSYISLSEAGKLSGYSAEYLRQLCVKGELDGQKVGNAWVITQDALDSFLQKNNVSPQEKAALRSDSFSYPTLFGLDQNKALENKPSIIPGRGSFITLSEASRLSGYSAEYLRQLIVKQKVLGQKIGNAWMTTPEAVSQFKQKDLGLAPTMQSIWHTRFELPAALTQNALLLFGLAFSVPVIFNLTGYDNKILALKTQYEEIITSRQRDVEITEKQYFENLLGIVRGRKSEVKNIAINNPTYVTNITNTRGVILGTSVPEASNAPAVTKEGMIAWLRDVLVSDSELKQQLKGDPGNPGIPGPPGYQIGVVVPTAPSPVSSPAGTVGTIGGITFFGAKELTTETLTVTSTFTQSGGSTTLKATTIDGDLAVAGNITPATDNTYDLGSATKRIRDIYLGPASLNIYSTTGTAGAGADYTLGNIGFSSDALTIQTSNAGTNTGGQINLISAYPAGNTTTSAFNLTTSTDLAGGDELIQIGD